MIMHAVQYVGWMLSIAFYIAGGGETYSVLVELPASLVRDKNCILSIEHSEPVNGSVNGFGWSVLEQKIVARVHQVDPLHATSIFVLALRHRSSGFISQAGTAAAILLMLKVRNGVTTTSLKRRKIKVPRERSEREHPKIPNGRPVPKSADEEVVDNDEVQPRERSPEGYSSSTPEHGQPANEDRLSSVSRMVDKRRAVLRASAHAAAVREGGGKSVDGLGDVDDTDVVLSDGSSDTTAEDTAGDERMQRVPRAILANTVERESSALFGLNTARQALSGDDWRHKFLVLRQLQEKLVADGEVSERDHEDVIPLTEALASTCRALRDKRPEMPGAVRLTQLMCSVIALLAKAIGESFYAAAAGIIPELLTFLSSPREAVQEAASRSVEVILTECHSPGVLRAATVPLMRSKKPYLRRKSSGFLRVAIDRWPLEAVRTTLPPIMGQLRKALYDADATVRREGRQTFAIFIRLWPAEGAGMYHGLERVHRRAVLQEQPHVSNYIGGKALRPNVADDGPSASSATAPIADNGAHANVIAGPLALPLAQELRGDREQQRPLHRSPGASCAKQRLLLQWKAGKEKEREDKRRTGQVRRAKPALRTTPPDNNGEQDPPDTKGSRSLTDASGVTARSVDGADARRGEEATGCRHASTSASRSTSRLRTPSSCSEGLRRAAGLALRKNDLVSPTLKRFLEDSTRLSALPRATMRRSWLEDADVESAVIGSPGSGESGSPARSTASEESGLSEEEENAAGDGASTPTDIRQSRVDQAQAGVRSLVPQSGGSTFFEASASSHSSGDRSSGQSCASNPAISQEESRAKDGLPSRVLFTDASPRHVSASSPTSDKFVEYPALKTKVTPQPTGSKPLAQMDLASAAHQSSSEDGHQSLLDIISPRALSSQEGPCAAGSTPPRAILTEHKVPSSSAKRRVMFSTTKHALEAGLSSPCSSIGDRSCFSFGACKVDSEVSHDADGAEMLGVPPETRMRGCFRALFTALVVAVSVAVVLLLGYGIVDDALRARPFPIAARSPDSAPSSVLTTEVSERWERDTCTAWDEEHGEHESDDRDRDAGDTGGTQICLAEIQLKEGNLAETDANAHVCLLRDDPAVAVSILASDNDDGSEGSKLQPEVGTVDHHRALEVQPEESVDPVVTRGQSSPNGRAEGELVRDGPRAKEVDPAVPESAGAVSTVPTAPLMNSPPKREQSSAHEASSDDTKRHETTAADGFHFSGEEWHTTPPAAPVNGAGATATHSLSDSQLASPPLSSWGWFEAGASVVAAVALLFVVACRAGGMAHDSSFDSSILDGLAASPSTPQGRGTGGVQDDDELGSYLTVEMVKRGGTPATLRSVKRSRRISSAQKAPRSTTTVVDLGATALALSNT